MEAPEPSAEILEGVVIANVQQPQYMLQRLPENAQLLSADLLQQNGIVVDLAGGDYIPVDYSADGLLSHDLTEDDRNLAAALVAVQLSQQQKQAQLAPSLDDQQLLLTDKDAASINNGFLQIVGPDSIYVTEKQSLPKLVKYAELLGQKAAADSKQKPEAEPKASRKSLPHKKRISKKLKAKPQIVKVQCTLCGEIFGSNEEFVRHEVGCQSQPVGTPFNCQICSDGFHNQLDFFGHLKAHYEPVVLGEANQADEGVEKEGVACEECGKTFRRQKALEAHVRDAHRESEFSEPEDLMAGIKLHVGEDEDDTKAWYKDDEIQQTEEDLKDIVVEEYICQYCKRPFPLRAILLQHVLTCRENKGKVVPVATPRKRVKKSVTLQCTECERTFTHRNSMIYHMRSHAGLRPYQCDQCGKSFFASSALKVHLRLHSGDKPYHCTECGKNFRQWGDLKYHMTSIHSNEKQFQCEFCGKDFARKYSLIVHRRIHTGEKNYKCEFCGKLFRASSYLQNHRRIHTGEKPHECDICGKPFRVRSDMKRHQKTHIKATPGIKAIRQRIRPKEVKVEVNPLTEEVFLNPEEEDNAEEILGFDHDQDIVRNATTLYQGEQLYLVSYSDETGSTETETTWIETGS